MQQPYHHPQGRANLQECNNYPLGRTTAGMWVQRDDIDGKKIKFLTGAKLIWASECRDDS